MLLVSQAEGVQLGLENTAVLVSAFMLDPRMCDQYWVNWRTTPNWDPIFWFIIELRGKMLKAQKREFLEFTTKFQSISNHDCIENIWGGNPREKNKIDLNSWF